MTFLPSPEVEVVLAWGEHSKGAVLHVAAQADGAHLVRRPPPAAVVPPTFVRGDPTASSLSPGDTVTAGAAAAVAVAVVVAADGDAAGLFHPWLSQRHRASRARGKRRLGG